jgi:prepilin-type N-terminal cleavage/methylation domain-containing protein
MERSELMLFRLPLKNSRTTHKGFTLIELLVVTGITAMIMLTATSMFATFLLSSARTNVRRQLQAEGNEVLRKVEFLVRNAADVGSACPMTSNSITLNTISNTTDVLALSGDALTETPSGGSTANLTSDTVEVTTLSGGPVFRCTVAGGTKYVDIAFSLRMNNPNNTSTLIQDFKTTVQVRNTSF